MLFLSYFIIKSPIHFPYFKAIFTTIFLLFFFQNKRFKIFKNGLENIEENYTKNREKIV